MPTTSGACWKLLAKKMRLRASVLDRTWDAWAEGHDRVFKPLLRDAGLTPSWSAGLAGQSPRPRSVQLLLHGSESSSLGGPTVRVPGTARELRKLGIAAEVVHFPDPKIGGADVLHGFNMWSPKTALAMARRARWLGKPFIFSPIFLDLSGRQFWQEDLLSVFDGSGDAARIGAALQELKERYRIATALLNSVAEPLLGYHGMAREALQSADHVIFLSQHEKQLLERVGIRPRAATIIRNPVDVAAFQTVDPSLFEAATGLRDYVTVRRTRRAP